VLPIEEGQWQVTLLGAQGGEPDARQKRQEDCAAFARSARHPLVADLIAHAEQQIVRTVVDDYTRPASRRMMTADLRALYPRDTEDQAVLRPLTRKRTAPPYERARLAADALAARVHAVRRAERLGPVPDRAPRTRSPSPTSPWGGSRSGSGPGSRSRRRRRRQNCASSGSDSRKPVSAASPPRSRSRQNRIGNAAARRDARALTRVRHSNAWLW
jgi:hypothetical protein